MNAVDTFMAVANATAAIVERAPAYVTYRVHETVRAAGTGEFDRTVTVRTIDGVAIVKNDTTGKDEIRTPFPAPPTFDELAKFKLSGQIVIGGGHGKEARTGDMRIENIEPLRYSDAATRADAVARSIKGYAVTFADDATPALGHLHLEPTSAFRATGVRHWLRDVWYDSTTLIPSRIVSGGIDDFELDAHYGTVNGTWLLQRISVAATFHAPLWLGRMTVGLAGDYADYAFSETAPDPRLAPGVPVPSPAPR